MIKLIVFASCLLILVSGHRHHDGCHHGDHRNGHQHGHDHSHGHGRGHGHGHGGHSHGHGHHHGRHHWHRHGPFVNFEAHEPNGLTVSMVQRNPNATFFGIELYVNRVPEPSQQCDVCHNTTTVTYGKFIVEDTEAVVKKGDALYYFVLLGDSSNVTRSHLQKLWVTDSIVNKCNCETTSADPDIDIRFGQPTELPDRRPTFGVKPTFPEGDMPEGPTSFDDSHSNELGFDENVPFECDLDPITNLCRTGKSDKLTASNEDLQREVDTLKAIVEHMRKSCGPRGTTNVLRLQRPGLSTGDIEQMTSTVKASFGLSPDMKKLTHRIARVIPDDRMSGAVLFEMVTYVDKQKVLYHVRMHNSNDIIDNDFRQSGRPDRRG